MKLKHKTLHIHVSNISEDVWEFINMLPMVKKDFEIRENAELSDRDLFCFLKQEHLILITPKSVDQDFLHAFSALFPKNHLQVLWPKKHTGELSLDILHDQKLLHQLIDTMKTFDRVDVTSYSATAQFKVLGESLKQAVDQVYFPETPTDTWMIEYFGTKMGFRQNQYGETGKRQFPMCKGLSIMGVHSAAQAAAFYYQKYDGVVVKTNKGHAGMGVLIIKKGELNGTQNLASQIATQMHDAYWEKFPIIIEEFVPCDPKVGGGFPNAECFVRPDGKVDYLYSCGMRVNPHGEFKGVEIGVGAMNAKDEKLLVQYGKRLGKMYAESGYCGYFDVDCLAAKDGTIFVSESNVRRTGGTHVYLAAVSLYGKNFATKVYAISNNLYQIEDKRPRSFKELEKTLHPILFSMQQKEGVLIVAANLLHRGVFGYIIFGKDKDRAHEIETKMEMLLRS